MKNNNTINYQKISKEAIAHGILLDYTDELIKEIEFLTPIREQYSKTLAKINSFRYKK